MPETPSTPSSRARWSAPMLALLLALPCAVGLGCDDDARREPPITTTSRPAPSQRPTAAATAFAAPTTAPSTAALAELLGEEGFRKAHEQLDGGNATRNGQTVALGPSGYLSLPNESKLPPGAVIVVHDQDGPNAGVRLWADRFAADGYAALAVDLYDGARPSKADEAENMARSLDEQPALAVLRAAVRFVTNDGRVRAERRAVLGWGMGASWALQLALREPGISAVVIYEGEPATDAAQLASLECPLLAVFGTAGSPPGTRRADRFEMGLEQAGAKRYRVLRYDAAAGFSQPGTDHYDPKAARKAWEAVREFLGEHLRTS